MKIFAITVIFVCILHSIPVKSQTVKVTGVVQDTSKNILLNKASVVIFGAKDSIIFDDTRTQLGHFVFSKIPKGKYYILISFPQYVDFVIPVELEKDSVVNLGNINLSNEALLLASVNISAKRVPIKIRGDTTEYDPLAYNLSPNATAEELLRRLQNFQVDKFGNITAQGKQINRVLVDGEEFFGNDPTLVTKNLRVDMIEKVQLFDKKSDQSAFTGINDGKDAKTVNFKLKKESKTGTFGKSELALGTSRFYQTQAFYNRFNNDEKFALYAFSNNTGNVGLSRGDRQQYSDGSTDASYNNLDLDTWSGEYSGRGLPTSTGVGSHYNNKFKEGKLSLNINYNFNDLDIKGNESSIIQENLPNNSFFTNSRKEFDNSQQKNNLNGELKLQLDTTSSISFKFNLGLIHKKTFNDYSSEVVDINGKSLNTNTRMFSSKANKHAGSTDFLYLKKLNKPKRTLSLGLNLFNTGSLSNGTIDSYTRINSDSKGDDFDRYNQYKENRDITSSITLKAVYTEPISKTSNISINYSGTYSHALLNRNTFDQSQDRKLNIINDSLSNNYMLDQLTQKGGLYFYYSKSKIRLQFGSDFAHTDFDQTNRSINFVTKKDFNNFSPSAEFSYNFTPQEGIVLKYNGYATLPTLEQIQPLINNIDPLNIYIGNPELCPSFTNSFSLNYIAFKTEKDLFLNAIGNFSVVGDPIISSVNSDSKGVSSYTYANLKDGKNLRYSASFSIGTSTHISDISMTVDGNFYGGQFENEVNSQLSRNIQNVYKLVLGFGKSKKSSYSCGINFGVVYNSASNSLQPSLGNKSWGYTSKPNFDLYLPYKIMLHTEGDYFFQGKTTSFQNDFSRFLWNSYIQKDFLKNSNISAKVSVNDILNQNKGFDRFINQNFTIQSTYETIRRYFMFSLVWNFRKNQIKK